MESFNKGKIIKTDFSLQFNYTINNKEYTVQIVFPTKESNYSIPYILALPSQIEENSLLAVEVNNLENESKYELIKNGLLTAYHLISIIKDYDNPVLIPILPSVKNGIPYYQQLSKECFAVPKDSPFYRIDLQVLNIIKEVKQNISNNANINDKIFLNGYSASGVFAQRFALLHPEIIDTLCVGGASGSIPIPSTELEYPLGTLDYSSITGETFNLEDYSQIKFRYYVGSLEDMVTSSKRFDENDNYAPLHDMSYFDRSIPVEIGRKQRNIFGRNLFARSKNEISIMNQMGLDIEQVIFEGRAHNNNEGIGCNELADQFINTTYQQSLMQKKL